MGGRPGAVLQEQFKMVGSYSHLKPNQMTRRRTRSSYARTRSWTIQQCPIEVLSAKNDLDKKTKTHLKGDKGAHECRLNSRLNKLACDEYSRFLKNKKSHLMKHLLNNQKGAEKEMCFSKNKRERDWSHKSLEGHIANEQSRLNQPTKDRPCGQRINRHPKGSKRN